MTSTEKIINDITQELNWKDRRIEYLEEENKKLRDEHYKDDEISKMKYQVETMRKDMLRGFPISEKEKGKINEWMHEHDVKEHGLDSLDKRIKVCECVGGRYTYEFIPTSIGVVGTVKCSCGKEFTFQELI